MSVYSEGTIALVCGTNSVVGSGTHFEANVKEGQWIQIPGLDFVLTIATILDDENITVSSVIPGPLGNVIGALIYGIPTFFTPILSIPLPGAHMLNPQSVVNRGLGIIDLELPKSS